jgi:hypothetical protein
MSKKKEETSIEEVKPKKPKANGKNSPVIGDNGLQTEPGDNAKYLAVSMELYKLPSIDLKDPEQVNKRLKEYFTIHLKNDLKPTVAGMGMALGLDRRRLWEIKTDALDRNVDIPTLTRDSIKKAYVIMENLWENYMQNGKINPVSGIFLGKNNFGYQDKTEHIITPTINSNNDYSAEEIRQRYLPDSATINSADFSDSDTES